ncbi:hypothetical protein ACFQ0B_65945 [Nonomuraea thailandensis]
MTDAIETQIERYAPGFRDRVLARHAMGRRRWRPTIPTWWAGTSGAGWPA